MSVLSYGRYEHRVLYDEEYSTVDYSASCVDMAVRWCW